MKHISLRPKVPLFFESLRDTEYTLETPMADIIDYSQHSKRERMKYHEML